MHKAGLSQNVAEELAEAIKEIQNDSLDNLATKQDLQILEQKIVIKLGSLMAVGIAILAALIKF